MPVTMLMPVKKLKMDLANFRTVPQADEIHEIQAIIAISPGKFWGLMDSLLEDGYLPTENIIVLKGKSVRSGLTVIEGNRRIGALKLIQGYISTDDIGLPDYIAKKIEHLPASWKRENKQVPCTIYEFTERKVVERIRSMIHGKAQKAGRDDWEAVARARHARDELKTPQPALDLLEKYLAIGKNHTGLQVQRWAGDFPITILDEAIKRLAPRFGAINSPDLVAKYPKIKLRAPLEEIIHDIGLNNITFPMMRSAVDFAAKYDIPPDPAAGASAGSTSSATTGSTGASGAGGTTGGSAATATTTATKTSAVGIDDPKAVTRVLRKFTPKGLNRDKVVTLRDEAKKLKLKDNPIAFCFLLRSMFEISAKAYCVDHKASSGPASKNQKGDDRYLIDVLTDITKFMTKNMQDRTATRVLHGAIRELANPAGILSITTMNQLVHHPTFSLTEKDIASAFGNVFPLLEAMNQ